MPFIPNSERPLLIQSPSKATKPGHLAYLIYREMKQRAAEPSWTKFDKIHMDFVMNTEDNNFLEGLYSQLPMTGYNEICNASSLAWQIFFQLVVMPYELAKRKENGDVQ